jgi:hypothetical protein
MLKPLFSEAFQLYKRWQKSITAEEEYFEGNCI